ncbi:sensor histidine kinase [Paenibacillus chitinolyticus]|uniref:sensor histidine kinase n=1 Tax=Paenibacillus chitinolyticus TaxID=79263 RepID=UPI00295E91C3|nr:ATP-binding protein [Paenibacillus chitinolyticus]
MKSFKNAEKLFRTNDAYEFFRIQHKDNGIGMTAEKAAKLLGPAMKETGGIGISNTNRRLIQFYGQGLSIVSKPGEGTTVSFTIPIK